MNNRYRIYLLYVHCTVCVQFLYTVQHRLSRVYIQSYFCDTKYTECKAFYPVVWIGSTHPLAHRRVLLPFPLLWVQGGRHTLLQGRGRGDPIPTKEQTLFLLLMYHTIIPLRCTEAGVLDERYSAKPAQRSSHTGLPGYIGRTRFPVLAYVDCRGGQISTFIPSIQIFDFYPIGRLPHLHFFFKIESKVNVCYLRFSVR